MTGEGSKQAWRIAAVGVCLALGTWAIWLRVTQIDGGLWLDEFGTLWAARGVTDGESIRRVYAVHGQSPAYYLVVRWAMGLFGESELTLRGPSVLVGCGLPFLAACALWPLSRRRAGLALLLFCVHPSLLFYSQQARPYALGAALVVLSVFGLTRALAHGGGAPRLLAWASCVAAAYVHPIFGPTAAALLVAVWATPAPRQYPLRTALIDATLAGVTLLPVLAHSGGLFGRRTELDWIRSFDPYTLPILYPGVLPLVTIAAGWAIYRRSSAAPSAPRRPLDRGLLACELALTALPLLAVGAVWLASGVSLVTSRYLLLSALGATLLCARLIAMLPWPLAFLALACVVLSPEARGARTPRANPQWREATTALDSIHLEARHPVVLVPGFVEVNRMASPPFGLPPMREAFLGSPVSQRPGIPPDPRPLALLPAAWGQSPDQNEYLERRVVPLLAATRRFAVIAPAEIERDFGNWLAWRFPGRFVRTSRSGEFLTVGVVSGWSAR